MRNKNSSNSDKFRGKKNAEETAQKEAVEETAAEENVAKQQEEAVEEVVYTAYTVSQMMSDLNGNALKAESTYNNQYVEITGRLSNIDSSGAYISIMPEDDEWAIIGVTCYIKTDEQKAQVMEMSVGDMITLKGKVTSVGEVMGYALDIDSINE